jgi:hypothetical protein
MARFAKVEKKVPGRRRKDADGNVVEVKPFKVVATFDGDTWEWTVAVQPKNHERAEMAIDGLREVLELLTEAVADQPIGPEFGTPGGATFGRVVDFLEGWEVTQPLPSSSSKNEGKDGVEY